MANTLTTHQADYWTREMARRLYGFNPDPRTNRIDEYARFNKMRQELYWREDARWFHQQRLFLAAFALLMGALFIAL